jgi:tetratricopeptide (TPR) repeat protein
LLGCTSTAHGGTLATGAQAAERRARSTPARLAHEGKAHLAQGDWVRAEQYLQLAIESGYPHADAIGPLLAACIASMRLRSALGHIEPYLRKHPGDARVRYVAAALHAAVDQPARALEEIDRVLRGAPEALDALYLRGVLMRDAFRDHASAARSFEAYLARAPHGEHSPELRAFLAEDAAEEGRP